MIHAWASRSIGRTALSYKDNIILIKTIYQWFEISHIVTSDPNDFVPV